MRIALYLTIILCFTLLESQAFTLKNGESLSGWKNIGESSWAQILVEKKLYRKLGSKQFFVHVFIRNKSVRPIAFDINQRSLFYINQWCPSNGPQRDLIDETRLDKPITVQDTLFLIDVLNNKGSKNKEKKLITLLKLKPGKIFDYYIAFNKETYVNVEKSNGRYIIIVMDGHMLFTDGKDFQVIERDIKDDNNAEVPIIAEPSSWGVIPAFSKVFN